MYRNSDSFLLQLRDIQLSFDDRLILDIPELLIPEGKLTLLIGPNGAGKTTLLRIMAGLQKPCTGNVIFRGEKVRYGGKQGLVFRRKVTMLAQEPYLFQTNVIENVKYGPLAHGILTNEAQRRAQDALKSVGCFHLAEKHSRSLSGGEKKRIALACMLSFDTELLLLDEPTAQVDHANSLIIKELISQQLNLGKTIVFSTHQPQWTEGLQGQTLAIEYGKLVPNTE